MAANSTIHNQSLNDDARTFFMVANVDVPSEDQVLTFIAHAPFEVEIIDIRHSLVTGSLHALVKNSGVDVDMAGAFSTGGIPANAGPLDLFTPDTVPAANRIIEPTTNLTLTLVNVDSGASGYVVQITVRRTQVNTA